MDRRTCVGLGSDGHRKRCPPPQRVEEPARGADWNGTQLARKPPISGLGFLRNEGQWPDEARFMLRDGPVQTFITDDALWFGTQKIVQRSADRNGRPTGTQAWVRCEFEGSSQVARARGIRKTRSHASFFKGSDPSRWRSRVSTYERVRTRDLYPGVDAIFMKTGSGFRYDLHVDPGVDERIIRIAIQGATSVRVTPDGDLELQTPASPITHRKPKSFIKREDGAFEPTPSRFVLLGENLVGFELPERNRSDAVLIDPQVTQPEWYFGFLGGDYEDAVLDVAVRNGFAYVTGCTSSLDFPAKVPTNVFPPITAPPYQAQNAGGSAPSVDLDVFVSQIDLMGNEVRWSTYIGGYEDNPISPVVLQQTYPGGLLSSSIDIGRGIVVDPSGHVYVAGYTNAKFSFPTATTNPSGMPFQSQGRGTLPPAQPTIGQGGPGDAFAFKLGGAGTQLLYSTYLSGHAAEGAEDIAVDSQGYAYVTGWTFSGTYLNVSGAIQHPTDHYPTTPGALHVEHDGSLHTGFLTKVNVDGSGIVYSSYLSSANLTTPPFDLARVEPTAIAIREDVNFPGRVDAYVTGRVHAGTVFTTSNASSQAGSSCLLVINSDCSQYQYATQFGSSNLEDRPHGITVNDSGLAGVVGELGTSTAPAVLGLKNPIQSTYGGGVKDGFIAVFDPAATQASQSLVMSSYYGKAGLDVITDITAYGTRAFYITGYRTPVTSTTYCGLGYSGFQSTTSCFITKFEAGPNGSVLRCEGQYGGGYPGVPSVPIAPGDRDEATGIAVDASGIYVVGRTSSASFYMAQDELQGIASPLPGFEKGDTNGDGLPDAPTHKGPSPPQDVLVPPPHSFYSFGLNTLDYVGWDGFVMKVPHP